MIAKTVDTPADTVYRYSLARKQLIHLQIQSTDTALLGKKIQSLDPKKSEQKTNTPTRKIKPDNDNNDIVSREKNIYLPKKVLCLLRAILSYHTTLLSNRIGPIHKHVLELCDRTMGAGRREGRGGGGAIDFTGIRLDCS